MSRQMNYLRKHQKAILAVMGVVCMVTFVIGPYLLDLVSGSRAANEDPLVVTWVGGKIRERELHLKQQTHQVAVNFLRLVIAETVRRGGSPVVNGQVIPRATTPEEIARTIAQIEQMDPGIPGDAGDSEEFTVVRMTLLAKKADELGIVVDQQSAREFLRTLSFPEVQEFELPALARQAIPEQLPMSFDQLLDQIAFGLKAQHMATLSQAGLFAVPPGQMWEYHNRLNRRVVIEAYPVEVKPFVSQVTETPTEAELLALFEEGKNRDPNPASAEPGFHRPASAAFAWLKIDFTPFVEAAKKQITAEQVAQQYELDKTQGKHKVLDLPVEPAKPTGEKKPDETKPEEKPASDKPAEEKPADTKPADEKPADEKPAEPAKPEEKPAATGDEPKPCGDDPPAIAEPKDPAKPADPAETPAETKPAETKPADPAVVPPPTPAPPPKFKPLAEVEDEIRTVLARPIAQKEMDAAIKKVQAEISEYGRKLHKFQDSQAAIKAGSKAAQAPDPGPLDLKALAAKFNFGWGSTEMVDRYTAADSEIGQKVMEFDMQAMRNRQFTPLSFADIAFARGSELLYDPQLVNSTEPDVSFLYWRTAEQETADVTFEDARKQVEEAWKLQKALVLAKAEAQKLADKAKSAASLKDVVDATKVKTTAPFSWLTTGSLAFGFSEPSLSSVPEIDLAGVEFMEAVFELKPGQTGIAPNQSHRIVYVVRVVSQEPEQSVLREQFLESGADFQSISVARDEIYRTRGEWFQELEKKMGLVWQRPPQESRR